MNCAIGEATVRSSTKSIALFGTSIRAEGACSSLRDARARVGAGQDSWQPFAAGSNVSIFA